jgi:phosphopantothenoylcysteine decarboxylase / phosphopantothenate---cysteine ligase
MDAAVQQHERVADVVVMAAAVADFRPEASRSSKWRRSDGPPEIALVANPDILAGVVERRGDAPRPVTVGFAAQTGDLEAAAEMKLREKQRRHARRQRCGGPGIGFESSENAVLILHADGRRREVPEPPSTSWPRPSSPSSRCTWCHGPTERRR